MLRRWWTASDHLQLLESERNLLAKLVRHPFHKPSRLQEEGNDDRKGGGGRELNLVEFRAAGSPSSPSLPTVVMAHGFGSGLSFFYRNVDDLLDSGKIGRVILVDWLGMGGSARPPCWESPVRSLFSTATTATTTETTTSRKFSLCNSEFSPSSAIDFFLDPFDRMMRNKELFDDDEPVWLIGHSLGGYLAGMYAMRQYNNMYNNDTTKKKRALNLTKLILLSPVGFRPQPTSPQRTRIASSSNMPPALRLVDALWSANLTPQALIRLMGSLRGRHAVTRALRGRIPQLDESELVLLSDYLYHVTVAPPSGEYAMNSLMEPGTSEEDGLGVYAIQPLGGGTLARAITQSSSLSTLKSIKVLYGDRDWMTFHEPEARLEMQRIQQSDCGIQAEVHIVPEAGHHLYLDNSKIFARHIVES